MSKYTEDILALSRAWYSRNHNQYCIVLNRIISNMKSDKINKEKECFIKTLETMCSGSSIDACLKELEKYGSIKRSDKNITNIVLDPSLKSEYETILWSYKNKDLLQQHNMNSINKIFLQGESGNGKTLFAEILANELGLPFYSLNSASIVGSLLGETQSKLIKAFQAVNKIECVFFIDEFDSLGASRSQEDVGEMKRIVNSLLVEIDNLSESVILIVATNLPKMLDNAIVRRFEKIITFGEPFNVSEYIHFLKRKYNADIEFTMSNEKSYAEIENSFRLTLLAYLMERAGE